MFAPWLLFSLAVGTRRRWRKFLESCETSLESPSPSEPTKHIVDCSVRSDGCNWRMLEPDRSDYFGLARVQRTRLLQTFSTSTRSPHHSPSTRFLIRHCLLSRTTAQWVSS